MTASPNVPHPSAFRNSPISKTGVLTIQGFGLRIRMQSGHLEIDYGVGPERQKIRFARIGHGLKRLACVSEDGFVTLAALKWLSDVGASFVMLDRHGKVRFMTGPTSSSDAKLRRAQAQAHDSGVAVVIAKELIRAKLEGQAQLVRVELYDTQTADAILRLRESLTTVETVEAVRSLEAKAAHSYWSAWAAVPILWPQRDLRRVPEHWRTFGTRRSLLSGASPRLATGPGNACMNYIYAILESEARLALAALGLDVGLGMLHADIFDRSSLAFDVMEPCRVEIDRWVLRLLRSPLNRKWFFETTEGNCRIVTDLCARLSETAPLWARAVAPWAEYVQRKLWEMIPKPGRRMPATRLTQSRKRAALSPEPVARVVPMLRAQNLCCVCGAAIRSYQRYCRNCRTHATQTPQAQARRAETAKLERRSRREWSPDSLPHGFDRTRYLDDVLPKLTTLGSVVVLATELGVSKSYARDIRDGKRIPHPRHWQALAKMAGFVASTSLRPEQASSKSQK